MGIKAIVEAVDDLPEDVKAFYKEDNGKFVLDVDGIDDHPKVRGVITANKTNKETRDRLRRELEEFKERFSYIPEDFDADAFASLQQAAEGKGGKPTEEQIAEMRDKLKASIEKQYAPKIDDLTQKLTAKEQALHRITIDDGLSKAMDDALIDPVHKSKLIPYLKSRGKIEVTEEDGTFKAVVDTDMGPVNLSQFVTEWASSDDGKIYVAKSTGPDPRGGKGGGGNGKTMKRSQFDALDPSEKRKAITDGIKVVD